MDSIFSLVRAEEMDSMVNVGGSELGLTPTRTACGLWTVLRTDPDDGRDAAVSLWCNLHDQMASSEVGGGLGLGSKGGRFSWWMAVGLRGLFALVCLILNLLTCHMTTLGHLGASLGTMQGKVRVTAPSIASATKPFRCCLSNAVSISW